MNQASAGGIHSNDFLFIAFFVSVPSWVLIAAPGALRPIDWEEVAWGTLMDTYLGMGATDTASEAPVLVGAGVDAAVLSVWCIPMQVSPSAAPF